MRKKICICHAENFRIFKEMMVSDREIKINNNNPHIEKEFMHLRVNESQIWKMNCLK